MEYIRRGGGKRDEQKRNSMVNNWKNVHWNVSQKMYQVYNSKTRLKVIASTKNFNALTKFF